MTASDLKTQLQEDVKNAMRNKEREALAVLRLITSSIKQVEVDERKELNDSDIVAVLDKMQKQRRESIAQFKAGGRDDLIANEEAELAVIQRYLPTPLTDDEIKTLVTEAVTQSSATSIKEMGKVMELLRPQMQGRADMKQVSALIKEKLSG